MGVTLTIVAFVCTVIFSAIGIGEKIKENGKLSTGTIISLTVCLMVMITGITDILAKDRSAKQDKQEILDKIDSTASQLKSQLNSMGSGPASRAQTTPSNRR